MRSEPRVPYLSPPDLVLLPESALAGNCPPFDLSIKVFGALVAAGVYLGGYLALRHARRAGLGEPAVSSFTAWVVGSGFVGGHVLDVLFYHPQKLLDDPWSLLRLWDGLSSFGGFFGAACGVVLWRWRYRLPALPYVESVATALPLGFVFGRAGCAVVHDHPGRRSDLFFAVQYPDGGRFDLGLYEMMMVLPIAVTFLVLSAKARPPGFYIGTLCLAYAPARFALDFLRVEDVAGADIRYGAFTPAQWGCFVLLAVGVRYFLHAMSGAARPSSDVMRKGAALRVRHER